MEIREVLKKITEKSIGCEDRCLDLRAVRFDPTPGDNKLIAESETYYFKKDPKNPKDGSQDSGIDGYTHLEIYLNGLTAPAIKQALSSE